MVGLLASTAIPAVCLFVLLIFRILVAVWSGVNVAGVHLFNENDKDAAEWTDIHRSVIDR